MHFSLLFKNEKRIESSVCVPPKLLNQLVDFDDFFKKVKPLYGTSMLQPLML
jgi:hypothetical protein